MANVFEQKKSTKVTLDDTTALSCSIETAQKKADHIEYIIRVQRGPLKDNSWQITKRYSDFEKLDAQLKSSNVDLPLPPKKVFGNFDREFIAERQNGLQNYLQAITCIPVVANSIMVKKFLDANNYSSNFLELALQHVSMIFRSEPNWDVVEPFPDIGWRIRKHFILIKPLAQPKVRQMLSWMEFGPDMYLPVKELTAIMKVLPMIKHPYIYPCHFTAANENGGMVIRDYYEPGTLRDYLCKCKPKGNYMTKYGNPKKRMPLDIGAVKTFGRQILEALKFLHDKGFPYGHLHAGNILVINSCCQLLDIENSIMGLPGYYRAFYTQVKKVQSLETIDVYCFGQVLYEMSFGSQINAPTCDQFPPECPAQIRSVLESILTTEACKNGLPSVADLLSHPLFCDVSLPPPVAKPVLKIPSKLKEFVKSAKEEIESRLKSDQKLLKQVLRISKAKEFHMSEEEKKKRRKSRKKALENGVSDSASSTSGTPAEAPVTPAPGASS
ncbi:PX domain-containing protein kinase-like protein isoform X2 [Aplysia californica]|uniref:PX domain-containing protein kinase-like protein isoform X2 n=1 Tax=Aplysia californica TaxID=6500 RepID=A0ABM1A1M4_APLCA|nr:PX domain-containing protein kinase-like protein isoform X2 [Aplysia californica]